MSTIRCSREGKDHGDHDQKEGSKEGAPEGPAFQACPQVDGGDGEAHQEPDSHCQGHDEAKDPKRARGVLPPCLSQTWLSERCQEGGEGQLNPKAQADHL